MTIWTNDKLYNLPQLFELDGRWVKVVSANVRQDRNGWAHDVRMATPEERDEWIAQDIHDS